MYDVFGLGAAIVDIEVNVSDEFLHLNQIAKGHMTLVDSQRMIWLVESLGDNPVNRFSGGSAANTIYAVQGFGHQTAYVCKVADDAAGKFFLDTMLQAGINTNKNAVSSEGSSGQCLVMITQDAERTMNTDLGVSSALSPQDVNFDELKSSRYFYVEGYLSSSPVSTQAAIQCRQVAQSHGVKVAVSLSDPSMVEFFRQPLQDILGDGVEQLYCNEEEAMAWANTDRLDVAIAELKDISPEVYITLGKVGSIVITKNGTQEAKGLAAKAVDTTGAGDIYAGACLAARCQDASPLEAARFANFSAAHLVAQYGARLSSLADYQTLLKRYT